MPIHIASILLMLLARSSSLGQNQLYSMSGKVVSTEGKSLAGASVSILKGKRGTVTNENGEFVLDGIPAGKQKVRFDYVGGKSRDTVLVFEGSVSNLIVVLRTDAKRTN